MAIMETFVDAWIGDDDDWDDGYDDPAYQDDCSPRGEDDDWTWDDDNWVDDCLRDDDDLIDHGECKFAFVTTEGRKGR